MKIVRDNEEMTFEEWLPGAKMTFNTDNLIEQLKVVWEAGLKAGQEPHDPEDWIQRALQAEAKLEVASWGQGEPVAEVVSYHQAGLYDELPIGTKLYTQAPAIPEDMVFVPRTVWDNAFDFVVQHSETWYKSGQALLLDMLAAAPKQK